MTRAARTVGVLAPSPTGHRLDAVGVSVHLPRATRRERRRRVHAVDRQRRRGSTGPCRTTSDQGDRHPPARGGAHLHGEREEADVGRAAGLRRQPGHRGALGAGRTRQEVHYRHQQEGEHPMRGTIRQRGEAWTWQHEYTSNAKRRYKTGTETTKRAAQKALNASLAAHDTGAHQVDPTKMTMAEYLRGWLDVKKLKVRPNTWRGYADHVDHLIAIIGDTKLSELAAPEIARCISQLREQGRCDGTGGLSGTTAQHVLRTLNTALRAAVKSHKIVRNPLDDLDDDAKPRRERGELVGWPRDEMG